jgi:hypothetical protein
MERKYWAYLHINGGIHVKAVWDILGKGDPAIDDAYTSPFVAEILQPYMANSREEAEGIARAKLVYLSERLEKKNIEELRENSDT